MGIANTKKFINEELEQQEISFTSNSNNQYDNIHASGGYGKNVA